jgi:hypothetical protein
MIALCNVFNTKCFYKPSHLVLHWNTYQNNRKEWLKMSNSLKKNVIICESKFEDIKEVLARKKIYSNEEWMKYIKF